MSAMSHYHSQLTLTLQVCRPFSGTCYMLHIVRNGQSWCMSNKNGEHLDTSWTWQPFDGLQIGDQKGT